MKTLLILRHAKSDWSTGRPDHDRPLNQRGKRTAPRIGQLLREEELVPDFIVSSTALRARKTAKKVAEACGYRGSIEVTGALYLSGAAAYVDVLRDLGCEHACLLVVGHNPAVTSLLDALTGSHETMPTAALAHVTLPIDDWSQLATDTPGALANLWRPGGLE